MCIASHTAIINVTWYNYSVIVDSKSLVPDRFLLICIHYHHVVTPVYRHWEEEKEEEEGEKQEEEGEEVKRKRLIVVVDSLMTLRLRILTV